MSATGQPRPRKRDRLRDFISRDRSRSNHPPSASGTSGTAPQQGASSVTGPSNSSSPKIYEQAFAEFRVRHPDAAALFDNSQIQEIRSSVSGDDLIKGIKVCQQTAEEKALKITLRNGKKVPVHQLLEPCVRWIQRTVAVGDTIVQYDPGHAALPWAGFRFVLQSLISHYESQSAFLEGACQVCRELRFAEVHCQLSATRSSRSNAQYVSQSAAVEATLKENLTNLYVSILFALSAFLRRSLQGTTAQVLNDTFSLGSQEIFEQIEVYKQRVIDAGQQVQLVEIGGIYHELKDLRSPILSMEQDLKSLTQYIRSQEREAALDWVSSIRYSHHWSAVVDKALNGTGQWIYESNKYKAWRHSDSSQALRIHGKAGSGKTPKSLLVSNKKVYIQFTSSANELQLGSGDGSATIHQILLDRYHKRAELGQIEQSHITSILQQLVQDHGETFIVIDALDETVDTERSSLINPLLDILDTPGSRMRILFTSRDDRFEGRLKAYAELRLVEERGSDDTDLYVRKKLQELIDDRQILDGQVSQDLRDFIEDKLRRSVDGMFQWVMLQMQAIRSRGEDEDLIRRYLTTIPTDLQNTYQELWDFEMTKLKTREQVELATSVFKWLLVLSEDAVQAANVLDYERRWTSILALKDLSILVGHIGSDGQPKNAELLVHSCFSLVEIVDGVIPTLRFCHLSVREFLGSQEFIEKSPDFSIEQLQSFAAQRCIELLSTSADDGTDLATSYPAFGWAIHAQRAGLHARRSDPLQNQLRLCLGSTSSTFAIWDKQMLALHRNRHARYLPDSFKLLPDVNVSAAGKALLTACRRNLHEFVPSLLTAIGSNALDDVKSHSYYGEIFGVAAFTAFWGHFETLQQLRDLGIDLLKSPAHHSKSVVEVATQQNHLDILHFLYDTCGLESRKIDLKYMLELATVYNNLQMVQFWVGKGASVKATADFDPLKQAYRYGMRDDIARYLLTQGADVNTWSSRSFAGTPLGEAALAGNMEMVRLLGAHHADINGCDTGDPLWCAAYRGRMEVVQYLLGQGASANGSHKFNSKVAFNLDTGVDRKYSTWTSEFRSWRSPLAGACHEPYLDIARVLLEAGADANGCGSGQPLRAAVSTESLTSSHKSSDRADIIELLLTNGAALNMSTTTEAPPLYTAMQHGRAHPLLAHGADPRFHHAIDGTLLHAAVNPAIDFGDPDPDMIKLALSLGVDVDALDRDHGTPLMKLLDWEGCLSPEYDTNVMEAFNVLIDQGANVNVEFACQTALDIARERKLPQVTRGLLEHDARCSPFELRSIDYLIADNFAAEAGRLDQMQTNRGPSSAPHGPQPRRNWIQHAFKTRRRSWHGVTENEADVREMEDPYTESWRFRKHIQDIARFDAQNFTYDDYNHRLSIPTDSPSDSFACWGKVRYDKRPNVMYADLGEHKDAADLIACWWSPCPMRLENMARSQGH